MPVLAQAAPPTRTRLAHANLVVVGLRCRRAGDRCNPSAAPSSCHTVRSPAGGPSYEPRPAPVVPVSTRAISCLLSTLPNLLRAARITSPMDRSEEHTSELQ